MPLVSLVELLSRKSQTYSVSSPLSFSLTPSLPLERFTSFISCHFVSTQFDTYKSGVSIIKSTPSANLKVLMEMLDEHLKRAGAPALPYEQFRGRIARGSACVQGSPRSIEQSRLEQNVRRLQLPIVGIREANGAALSEGAARVYLSNNRPLRRQRSRA